MPAYVLGVIFTLLNVSLMIVFCTFLGTFVNLVRQRGLNVTTRFVVKALCARLKSTEAIGSSRRSAKFWIVSRKRHVMCPTPAVV